MGSTLAEKILAAHADMDKVRAGQFVDVTVDIVLSNDITAPIAIREFEKLAGNGGSLKVFEPERVVMVADHFVPNKDIQSAEQCLVMRQFARAQALPHHYDVGRMGIEHVLLPEEGLVLPGDVVVGADSHTCTYGALGAFATGMGSTDIAVAMATGRTWMRVPETLRLVYHGELRPWVGGKDLILRTIGQIGVSGARYKAMEFAGPMIDRLSVEGRLTMANMAIEAGAKTGLFEVDDATRAYLDGRAKRPYEVFHPDADANYAQVIEIDASQIEPQVAFPHLPENTRPVCDAGQVHIDQSVIGSCTNGRLEDLRVAAAVLRGRRVHPDTRCIVIPGSQRVYLDALREGLVEIFVEAGAAVSTPTCGPCLGGYMGVLAAGERAVSTTNRNFRGRMGHRDSEVYLAGPAVAAASAVAGRIVSPDDLS
jgi:3-isopropylmalate/(R)-2-methylmalate dehydratase large subunit